MTTQNKQEEWVKSWLSSERLSNTFQLVRLLGDGSTRSFYRLIFDSRSAILLWDPDWTLSQDYPSHQQFLKSRGVAVPNFLKVDAKSGVLLMEDLGDDLLQHKIQKETQNKQELLEQTIKMLADLQGSTYPVPDSLPCAKRFFDKEKYSQELQFTLEHLAIGLLKGTETKNMSVVTALAEKLEKIKPICFSHRDFHTRNILPHQNKLYLIDFQDARMGPPHYDLASILYDAYMPLTESEKNHLITLYKTALQKHLFYKQISWETFDEDLKLVALQRTIKAAGSFASFYTRYKKATHIPYLVPALEMALQLQKSLELPQGFQQCFPIENWISQSKHLKLQ